MKIKLLKYNGKNKFKIASNWPFLQVVKFKKEFPQKMATTKCL